MWRWRSRAMVAALSATALALGGNGRNLLGDLAKGGWYPKKRLPEDCPVHNKVTTHYPLGNQHIPQKWHFEDDFPFPQVGYVNSLEGKMAVDG